MDDDEKLKIFGELLSNKTSRDIIRSLMSKSNYKKKIADELELPFSLVEHHLKKLEKLGLVKITNKKLIKKGVFHKNYKINADGIFVTFNSKEKIEEKGILKKIFKDGIKFASIGIAALISFIITQPHEIEVTHEIIIPNESTSDTTPFSSEPLNQTVTSVTTEIITGDVFSQFLTVLVVISLGVFLILFSKKKKKGQYRLTE